MGLAQAEIANGSIPAWAGETGGDSRHNPRKKVYPRVGGGNRLVVERVHRNQGLSPRGRGKQAVGGRRALGAGSIPAWAGETIGHYSRDDAGRVYPRVGGGNDAIRPPAEPGNGLSPRGRGKHRGRWYATGLSRSIPAWAGETLALIAGVAVVAVYPRVGGGNAMAGLHTSAVAGLSPRGRGKPVPPAVYPPRNRSIPAWAGETVVGKLGGGPAGVYPRVGGGNGGQPFYIIHRHGLSPRGRGKPRSRKMAVKVVRSIPAWAGETRNGR